MHAQHASKRKEIYKELNDVKKEGKKLLKDLLGDKFNESMDIRQEIGNQLRKFESTAMRSSNDVFADLIKKCETFAASQDRLHSGIHSEIKDNNKVIESSPPNEYAMEIMALRVLDRKFKILDQTLKSLGDGNDIKTELNNQNESEYTSDFRMALSTLTELSDPNNRPKLQLIPKKKSTVSPKKKMMNKMRKSLIGSVPEIVSAVRSGDIEKVKEMIHDGGDLDERQLWTDPTNQRIWFGESALMVAVESGNAEMIKELLLNQADPMLESCIDSDHGNFGKTMTALLVARKVWLKAAAKAGDRRQSMSDINRIINMVRRVNALWRKCNPHYIESADADLPREIKKKPSRFDLSMTLSFCK